MFKLSRVCLVTLLHAFALAPFAAPSRRPADAGGLSLMRQPFYLLRARVLAAFFAAADRPAAPLV